MEYHSRRTAGRRRARRPATRADRPAAAGRREDPSRTRQSLLTLATFRSWGIHWMTPHEGPSERLPDPAPGCEPSRPALRDRSHRPGLAPGMDGPIYSFLVARGCRRVERLEDSPSGLWRTLGKRVGCKPSGVRIPHPPPLNPGTYPGSGVLSPVAPRELGRRAACPLGGYGLKDKTCWFCGDFSACWCVKVGVGGGCFIVGV